MLGGCLHTLQVPTLFRNLNFLLVFYNRNKQMPCTKMSFSFFFLAHLSVMNLWLAYLKQNECNVLYAGGHLQCENSRYISSILIILSTWVQWVFKDFQEVTVCKLSAAVKTVTLLVNNCNLQWAMCFKMDGVCVCVQPGVVRLLSSAVTHLQHKTLSAGKEIFSSMSTWYS